MRVTLGYAWGGHAANETVNVPDKMGRQLLRTGKARAAVELAPIDPPESRALLNPEEIRALRRLDLPALRAFALDNEIDLGAARRKAEILALIEASPVRTGQAPDAE